MLVKSLLTILKYRKCVEGNKMHQAVQESRWLVRTGTSGCMYSSFRSSAVEIDSVGGSGDFVKVGVL